MIKKTKQDLLEENRVTKPYDELTHSEWREILISKRLTEEFLNEFIEMIDIEEKWIYISIHQELSENFIKRYEEKLDWSYFSAYQQLTESFIEEYEVRLNWDFLSRYQKLSERLIEKYLDQVNWDVISKHQNLSESFILEHQNRVNWVVLSRTKMFSERFVSKMQDRILFRHYFEAQRIDYQIIRKFLWKTNYTSINDIYNKHLTKEEKINIEKMLEIKRMFKG